ncbi:Smr/MutS family protein [Sphingomonas sp. RT2P30]|uniref:Smr/MutS family protein n=1 Tax=Parasphingomonas halimpatiens TaxID=3096162 RepID=UPI002FCB6D9F
MSGRRLSADEAALWARVMANVRPIEPARKRPVVAAVATPVPAPGPAKTLKPAKPIAPPRPVAPRPVAKPAPAVGVTLDGGWDRKLSRGIVAPDRTIDLHGHNLDTAYRLLDGALGQAIGAGERVVLLVTGRPPRAGSERPHARGAIRAAVGDWLAGSRHAGAIAAVRGAHPRHGGAGALYIVLRRPRDA